jgi:hypothetical protein
VTTALFYSAAPVKLNSTVLAGEDLGASPSVVSQAFRHSGNLFSSVMTIPGAAPRFTFKTPFYEAYNLIGLQSLKLTTFELYLAKFVDAVRGSGSARKYSLTAACAGFATITGASVSQGGVMMADVEIAFQSDTGMAHPWTPADNGTIPTLSAEPALRTLGPVTLNGTTNGGYVSCAIDFGNRLESHVGDGCLFPTVIGYVGGDPVLTYEHADPATMLTTIGLTGAALTSNAICYFRDYSTTTHLALTTGLSLTVASGRVIPEDFGASSQGIARGGIRIAGLSSTATHPIVVATGASVP